MFRSSFCNEAMLGKVLEFRLQYSETKWGWKENVNKNFVHRLVIRRHWFVWTWFIHWTCIWVPYCVYFITNIYISFPSYTILFTFLYYMFRSLLDHLQVYYIQWSCYFSVMLPLHWPAFTEWGFLFLSIIKWVNLYF
jgi:hypothetical protein